LLVPSSDALNALFKPQASVHNGLLFQIIPVIPVFIAQKSLPSGGFRGVC